MPLYCTDVVGKKEGKKSGFLLLSLPLVKVAQGRPISVSHIKSIDFLNLKS